MQCLRSFAKRMGMDKILSEYRARAAEQAGTAGAAAAASKDAVAPGMGKDGAAGSAQLGSDASVLHISDDWATLARCGCLRDCWP